MKVDLARIVEAYDTVRRKHDGLPAVRQARFHHTEPESLAPGPCAAKNCAWKWLSQHRLNSGWLQFQSTVCTFRDGRLPDPHPDWGVLIAADASTDDGSALRLRPDGRGQVVATVLTEGEGNPALADEVSHLAAQGAARIVHQRYWSMDSTSGGLIPTATQFAGLLETDR